MNANQVTAVIYEHGARAGGSGVLPELRELVFGSCLGDVLFRTAKLRLNTALEILVINSTIPLEDQDRLPELRLLIKEGADPLTQVVSGIGEVPLFIAAICEEVPIHILESLVEGIDPRKMPVKAAALGMIQRLDCTSSIDDRPSLFERVLRCAPQLSNLNDPFKFAVLEGNIPAIILLIDSFGAKLTRNRLFFSVPRSLNTLAHCDIGNAATIAQSDTLPALRELQAPYKELQLAKALIQRVYYDAVQIVLKTYPDIDVRIRASSKDLSAIIKNSRSTCNSLGLHLDGDAPEAQSFRAHEAILALVNDRDRALASLPLEPNWQRLAFAWAEQQG